MKNNLRILSLLIALALTLAALPGCACAEEKASAEARKLKVGVRADIMGFGYLNPTTGKYYGLEVDLANELARRMGYSGAEFTTVVPADREDKLLGGEVEVVMACYTVTEERREIVDFSAPYYGDYAYIIVQNSALLEHPEQLLGLTIGTVAGTNSDTLFRDKMRELGLLEDEPVQPNFIYRYSNDYEDLSRALETGLVDAICMDGAIAKTYMNDDRSYFRLTLGDVQNFAAATAKGSDLSVPVAEAMQAMLDDGTVDRLIDKWN